MKGRLIPLLLALVLTVSAAGCATTQATANQFNATAYVQGLLDETYTGKASEIYLTLMDTDEETVAKNYRSNLLSEYKDRFLLRFEIDDTYVTGALRDDFLDLIEQVYAKVKYTVKSAVLLDDSRYCVEVTVTPVTFFAAAYSDGFANLVKRFEKEHPDLTDEERREMSVAQLRQFTYKREGAWAQAVYDYLYPRLSAVTSGAAVTKLLLVSPDSKGYYTVSPTDFQDLDDRILAY